MADDERSSFSDLPSDLLAQISAYSHGFPLLAVSRRGRDAVLERARSIQLKLIPGEWLEPPVAPVARLLDRACRAAMPGLHCEIEFGYFALGFNNKSYYEPESIDSPLLSVLLQRGLDTGGWGSVHTLSLVVRDQGCL